MVTGRQIGFYRFSPDTGIGGAQLIVFRPFLTLTAK